jgi:hypothetical protein
MHRPAYVLEFWNGDRWYPELLARARTNEGRRLTLQSNQLRPLTGSTASGKWKEFDYYSPEVFNEVGNSTIEFRFPERLNITVIDEHGNVLGTEVIVLHLETRRDLAFESV